MRSLKLLQNGVHQITIANCECDIPNLDLIDSNSRNQMIMSLLVDVADCCVDALTIKIHALHPVLKVPNFLKQTWNMPNCHFQLIKNMATNKKSSRTPGIAFEGKGQSKYNNQIRERETW